MRNIFEWLQAIAHRRRNARLARKKLEGKSVSELLKMVTPIIKEFEREYPELATVMNSQEKNDYWRELNPLLDPSWLIERQIERQRKGDRSEMER